MFTAKEKVLDRIEQSFVLFKNNFLELFLPIFLYNLFSVLVFGTLGLFYVLNKLSNISTDVSPDFFTVLNNPIVVIMITFGMIIFIAYLLINITFILGLIKSIQQASKSEQVTPKENILYGFKNLFNSFKTYWYIFAYVALIPALIFIVGGILFNLGFYYDNSSLLLKIGGALMVIAGILFFFFAIVRGIKATFPLYNAVEKGDFSKENFSGALKLTKNNWWRVLGNFALVGLIIGLVTGMISGVIGIITPPMNLDNIKGLEDIKSIVDNFSIIGNIISNTLKAIINNIGTVFMIIFTYVFFKRLEDENSNLSENIMNKETKSEY
ncbi:hypothetical protein A9Q91_03610 [Candidatus Gracilibacteria bacterium 28_42_T64]|nr:hypothetical protein A9Q91_03610 [Candidatus Gracilibacteria bacterium 28_42_T64]